MRNDMTMDTVTEKSAHNFTVKRMKWVYFIIGILCIAAFLRFYQLGSVPASLDWDEVAHGYNAYSILKTGRDEYGQPFPLILRSFDDYKPALYTYLTMPFVAVLGPTHVAVRLPAAIIGVVAVLGTYLLVLELFRTHTNGATSAGDPHVTALLTALLLTISPWHLQFTRAAFEASVGLALIIFGILAFLRGFRKHWWWYVSAASFGLSVYAYQSEKVFMPLITLALFLVYFRKLASFWPRLIGPAMLFLVVTIPFYWVTLTTPDALLRAKGVSLFADQTPYLASTVVRLEDDRKNGDYIGLMLDNRRVTYARGIMGNYMSHFDLNWLFITGDQARHQPPNFGHLYLVELPFLLIGIYMFFMGKYSWSTKLLVGAWLLLAPVPAAITTGVPHPIRTIHLLPLLQLLTVIGILGAIRWLWNPPRNRLLAWGVNSIIVLIALWNIAYYLDAYFVQYDQVSSQEWQYGYKEAVQKVKEVQDQYDKIVVHNRQPMDQAHIFFLFYLAYDPAEYLRDGGTYSGGFAEENRFGKFEFRAIDWDKEQRDGRTLFIGPRYEIPSGWIPVHTVYYLNGKIAMILAE